MQYEHEVVAPASSSVRRDFYSQASPGFRPATSRGARFAIYPPIRCGAIAGERAQEVGTSPKKCK